MGTYESFTNPEQGERSPLHTVNQNLCDDLCQMAETNRVGDVRLVHCTDAQLASIEARALASMRVQLVRVDRSGCFGHTADYHIARRAWELAVMNRERLNKEKK